MTVNVSRQMSVRRAHGPRDSGRLRGAITAGLLGLVVCTAARAGGACADDKSAGHAAVTDRPTVGQVGSPITYPLLTSLLWRAGGGLAAPIALGPNSEVYAATRYGVLDVIEPNGKLRFSVTLGGLAVGPLFVDTKGSAFAATSTGVIVGIGTRGNRLFSYRPPTGVRQGLTFGEQLGLLFVGRGNVVLGLNRSGYPIFRYESHDAIEFGPLELGGFCVAVTATGKLVSVNRAQRKFTRELGGNVTAMERTAAGGLWILVGSQLVGFDRRLQPTFELPEVLRFTTTKATVIDEALAGVVLRRDGTTQWLGEQGNVIAERKPTTEGFDLQASSVSAMTLDDGGALWLVANEATLVSFAPSGHLAMTQLTGTLHAPLFDRANHRFIIANGEGSIFAGSRPFRTAQTPQTKPVQ